MAATEKDPNATARYFETKDRFGALLGGRILSLTKEECIYEYVVRPEHFNPTGILHGGALFGAMDSSQGCFIHFILDTDAYKFASTGTATVKYLAPVTGGKIRIRSWLKGQERRKIFIASVAVDERGATVATLEEIWIAILKS
jgi:uncharacterized protein (TIGR00369 family)